MKRSIFSRFVPTFLARLVPPFLRRRLPSLSVRARIALLALIPVVGFVANGINYIVSEREVGQAFDAVNRSNDLTDASAALRSGLESIRFVAKEMAFNPSPPLVKSFNDHHAVAVKSLELIQKTGDPEDTRTIPHILRTVAGLKDNFATLAKGLEEVGFNERQ